MVSMASSTIQSVGYGGHFVRDWSLFTCSLNRLQFPTSGAITSLAEEKRPAKHIATAGARQTTAPSGPAEGGIRDRADINAPKSANPVWDLGE